MDERDPDAFRALYRAHYATVCRYLAVRVHRSAVEDVAAPGTPAGSIEPATDYVVAQRLPRTPANEALLRMLSHPGAKLVTEGRF
jgi:hypothetical protein